MLYYGWKGDDVVMRIEFKAGFINLEFNKTTNQDGLPENDYWLDTKLDVETNDFHYHVKRPIISSLELKNLITTITSFYNHEELQEQKIHFIRNYWKIILTRDNETKKMQLKLIDLMDINKPSYKLAFVNEEILTFLELLKQNDI